MWTTIRTAFVFAAVAASAVIWREANAEPRSMNEAVVEVVPTASLLRTAQLHSVSGAALRSISIGY